MSIHSIQGFPISKGSLAQLYLLHRLPSKGLTSKMEEDPVASGLNVDVGYLLVFDERPERKDATAEELATEGTMAVFDVLNALPTTRTSEGKRVTLPKGTFQLPREKPIPKERPMTKWEKFAREKGIQKRTKRDRLVFDETTEEFVPRYGKGSKNALDRQIIIPYKEGTPKGVDPFSQKREDKKKLVKLNMKQKRANIGRAAKKSGLQPMQALTVAKTGPSGKKILPKHQLNDSLAVVQKSTASAGKFDSRVPNEPKQKVRGRKKKLPVVGGKDASLVERQRMGKIADRLLMNTNKNGK